MKLKSKTYFILKSLPKIGNLKALKIAKKLSTDIINAKSFLNEYIDISESEKNLPSIKLSDLNTALDNYDKELKLAQKEKFYLIGFDDDTYPSS